MIVPPGTFVVDGVNVIDVKVSPLISPLAITWPVPVAMGLP